MSVSHFGPPGYGQPAPPTRAAKTAVFTVLALLIGLGVGVVLAVPIFSGSTSGTDNEYYASAEYETEVFCNYAALSSSQSDEERGDMSSPHLWRIYALANLANAASSVDPSIDDYDDFRGTDLIIGFSRVQPEMVEDELKAIQGYCDARN